MKRYLPLLALAPGLLLLAGTQARADWSPAPEAVWTYKFTPAQQQVTASQGGSVSFTGETGPPPSGESHVTMTSLRATSSVQSPNTEILSSANGAWTSNMKIAMADNPSTTASMTFTGNLSGTLSAQNVTTANTFNPSDFNQTATISDPVSGMQYRFRVVGMNFNGPPNPTPPGDTNSPPDPGTMGVTLAVDEQPIVSTASAPEPTSLLLSCLGLSFLATRVRKGRLIPLV
jgi:hypothetical protein